MTESTLKSVELGKLNLDSADKLNRIRDLLFGQQSRDLDQKLERQRQELVRIGQEIGRVGESVRALESSFGTQLKALSDQMNERLNEQDSRHTQLLNSVEQHFQQEIAALTQSLHESELALLSELRETAERLHDRKTDRLKLASLFMNIGTTLQSHDSAEEVSDLLQELVKNIE